MSPIANKPHQDDKPEPEPEQVNSDVKTTTEEINQAEENKV